MNWTKLPSKVFKKLGFQPKYKKSYSQCGEDLIIRFIFNNLKISKPTFIDIGANHPYLINNTYLLYKNGSRGINIEPNINLFKRLKRYRRKDINLNIGVSDKEGVLDFYRINPDTMSTFSKEEALRLEKEYNYKIDSIEKIKIETINKIIQKYFNGLFPDLLSIDVEGYDEQILKSIDYEKSAPTIIVTETIEFSMTYKESFKRNEIIDFLLSKGYIVYADTMINTIFVRKEKLFMIK